MGIIYILYVYLIELKKFPQSKNSGTITPVEKIIPTEYVDSAVL